MNLAAGLKRRPLLFLDVDGPLNPFAAKPTRRPDGYETHRTAGDFAALGRWAHLNQQADPASAEGAKP